MGYFPRMVPELETVAYWIAGFVATVVFFFCLLLHELAHSLVAIRSGQAVPAITLFVFGGMSHLSEDPRDPKTEFKIAVVGPVASLFLAGIFWSLAAFLDNVLTELPLQMIRYLAWINLALAVFNLIPGFPLDGGRIFRALWWWKTGSIEQATKMAANIGKGFAICLIILGALQIFSGLLVAGLWFIFIGMFLRGLAQADYQQLLLKNLLGEIRAEQMMIKDVVTVPSNSSVEEAIHGFFLRYGYGGFPVRRNGQIVGLVSLGQIKDVPEAERGRRTVDDVMKPLGPDNEIAPSTTLADALAKMTRDAHGRLLVVEDGKAAGMITRTGLFRYLQFKQELGA